MSILDDEEVLLQCLGDNYTWAWDDWPGDFNTQFTKPMRELINDMMVVCPSELDSSSILSFFTSHLKYPWTKSEYSCHIYKNKSYTGAYSWEIIIKRDFESIISIYLHKKYYFRNSI